MAKPNVRTFSSAGNAQKSMESVEALEEQNSSDASVAIAEEEKAAVEAVEGLGEAVQESASEDKAVGVVEAAPVVGVVVTKAVEHSSAPTHAEAASSAGARGVGVVVESQAAGTDSLSAKLAGILKDVPAAHQVDIARLRMYCAAMAPGKPVDNVSGAREQSALYRLIQNIINRQETHFTALFTALLAVFNAERKGALGDRHRNRFMEHVALPSGDRTALLNLTHLLSITADPKARQVALKQVAFEKALANGLTEEGRLRVLQYYGV